MYLTGSHTWDVFQKWLGVAWRTGENKTVPAGRPASFAEYLDVLQGHGHNFIRFWVADTARSTATQAPIEPQPFVRTGPGQAADGGLKFDLTRLNPEYFDELRARVAAARDRGIYVGIMLFNAWGVSKYGRWRYPEWDFHPFNKANNVNGINGDPDGDGVGLEYHTLAVPAVTMLQEAYVRKVVDTVNDLNNVLYEISNESDVSSVAWQYHMAGVIRKHQAAKPGQHPVGITAISSEVTSAYDNPALFNGPADWVSPVGTEYFKNPPVADGTKVILNDTDHHHSSTRDAGWPWRAFLRGHNPIAMDWWTGTPWESIRRALGHTRRYAEKMDLAAMTPRNDLSSTTYCLANPGSEYLVYQPSPGVGFTVDLASGRYACEWFDAANGVVAGTEMRTVPGGTESFSPPFGGHGALYLRRR